MTLRWKSHPDRVASLKNMSHSELSRRRLVPATRRPRKGSKGVSKEEETTAPAESKSPAATHNGQPMEEAPAASPARSGESEAEASGSEAESE